MHPALLIRAKSTEYSLNCNYRKYFENAVILLDKKNLGETFHISSKRFISILELTKLISKLMNVKNKKIYHVKERDGKDLKYTLNSNKIRNYYSWSEKTNLEEGLINTINWVTKNFNFFKKASLKYSHKK
jgi:dTDP-glucose 4,6-dehydratase